MSVRSLAAAQSHARNRQQKRAMTKMEAEMERQRAEQQAAADKARSRQKWGGAIQMGLGGLGLALAPLTGGISAGPGAAMLIGGLGSLSNSPELSAMSGPMGQMVAGGVNRYYTNQAAGQLTGPGSTSYNQLSNQIDNFNAQLPSSALLGTQMGTFSPSSVQLQYNPKWG